MALDRLQRLDLRRQRRGDELGRELRAHLLVALEDAAAGEDRARGELHAGHRLHLLQDPGGEAGGGVGLLGDRLLVGDHHRGSLQRVAEDLVEGSVDGVGDDVRAGDQRDADEHRDRRAERPQLPGPEALDGDADH